MFKKLCLSSLVLSSIIIFKTPSSFASSITPQEDLHVRNHSDVIKVVKQVVSQQQTKSKSPSFSIENIETDPLNYTHYTLYPKYDKHLATDKEIKVHVNPKGKVILINGDFEVSTVRPSNQIKLSKEEALNRAFKSIKMNRKQASNGENQVVQSNQAVINTDQEKYIYDIELITLHPSPSHWHIQVNADNGAIIEKTNLIQSADTIGTGVGVRGDEKPIHINKTSDGYRLEDISRPSTLSAYRLDTSTGIAKIIKDTDTRFDAPTQRAGVDANVYAGQVYDYFKNTFNRNSYDDNGSPIISITHVNQFQGVNTTNNAAWIGDKMIYGDGDNSTYLGFSGANDIIAHELTHGITQETANLDYNNQPGALNESFSDVFAYFIDFEDTLIGEDIYKYPSPKKALRSMENPTLYNQPAHMNQYVRTNQDSGGVHANSGIPNKAAYLTTQKLGKSKAEQIYYRALTNYITSNAQFIDAKHALEQSALDLYGQEAKQAVTASWDAVGVK
ncbi:M4 family metallopeptidase [Staphylococcus felis]|uniref:M4 family metallopeptidase n=1 Tax=Staphylococcus felis TaxID=46127 RepID=UPI000CD18E82|nr:M4 family metallopeptidase [Staphylococcus felis]AVP35577.1 peptidase M4 family protein [Staphylococcus felis]MDQ7192848.1 M4 family metallopeptidase [Staphylococcus felis]PNZ34788.1 aureolysin [Staphylococcus felis]QQB02337.1 peptidase M4 family protein [Staphylococcus felis]REI04695.1 peptidase M4 family protein [Staphylococcus felis]